MSSRTPTSARWLTLIGLMALGAGSACRKEPEPAPAPTPKPTPVAAAPAKPAVPPKPAPKPLLWDDPKEWKRVKPSSSMRVASYEIPPVKGDKAPGELNVFVLGGSVEDNIKRWVDEFSGFDPKSVVRTDRSVNDLSQAVVEVPKGTFSGGMATMTASQNYGLLGAIVSTPSEAKYFFKLTGPSATLKAARDPFYRMLDSMRIEGGPAQPPGVAPAAAPSAPTPAAPAPSSAGASPK